MPNEELHRLRKENRELKKKLHKLEKAAAIEQPSAATENSCYTASNYFSFLLSRLRKKEFYAPVQKATRYLRNSLWVTRIFRLGVLLYQYLQAGAFVLVYTAVFILIIPILLAVAIVTLILALLLRSRNAAKLLHEAKQDAVFLIPNGKDGFDGAFLEKEVSRYPDSTVLIVTPFFLKRQGIGEKNNWFVCFRKEKDDVYILRNYFFFYFRRRLKADGRYTIREVHTFGDTIL